MEVRFRTFPLCVLITFRNACLQVKRNAFSVVINALSQNAMSVGLLKIYQLSLRLDILSEIYLTGTVQPTCVRICIGQMVLISFPANFCNCNIKIICISLLQFSSTTSLKIGATAQHGAVIIGEGADCGSVSSVQSL